MADLAGQVNERRATYVDLGALSHRASIPSAVPRWMKIKRVRREFEFALGD
jgi:hypothetical protein